MTKLPEPLPFDYVDELIDENFIFINKTGYYQGDIMNIHSAFPREGARTNTPNHLINWKYDYYGDNADTDDYTTWNGMSGHEYTAEGFTEEELDTFVRTGNVYQIKQMRKLRNGEVPEDSNIVQEGYGEQGEDDSWSVDDSRVGVPV